MIITMAGDVKHAIKVTRLNDCWGVRCFTNGTLNQEIRVHCKEDIGVAAAEMLRFEDKCGNISEHASCARERFFKADGSNYRTYKKPHREITITKE